jgi:formylglycine-generating enzyme required for sulfatase activity
MNEYKGNMETARRRQRKIYFIGFIFLIVTVLVVGFALLSAGGTPIKVTPTEVQKSAKIIIKSGVAVLFDNVIYSLAGNIKISVEAVGYRHEERIIESHKRGQSITVDLIQIPSRVTASTEPNARNTKWFIDGVLVNTGKALDRELEPGLHKLKVDNPYYYVVEREFESKRAQNTELTITLEPVIGSLDISTQPVNSLVMINGKAIIRKPMLLNRKGGIHSLLVSSSGYTSIEEQIEITNSKSSIKRFYQLAPLSADLTVIAKPVGGQLTLNGKRIDSGNKYQVDGNEVNKLSYHKQGYVSTVTNITVKPKGNETVQIKLLKEFGKIDLKSNPSADVYINNVFKGTTPTTLVLQTVPVDIELRKSGYISTKQNITPSSRRIKKIYLLLQTETASRLSNNPDVYVNSIGMKFKRFSPTPYIMGAPRSERGQRANEFKRNVTFKKMFYSGLHEVTNLQYKLFDQSHGVTGNTPVVGISWIEAAMFCNWLSKNENRQPFYRITDKRLASVDEDADGYRLLTEAEWEWLARKSGKAKQTIFPWGNDSVVPQNAGNIADETANGVTKYFVPNYNDGYVRLAPIGSYPSEVSGLFDVTGNASEWVHDYYSLVPPKKEEILSDPLGPTFGDAHIVKGSSWRSGTRSALRAAHRYGSSGGKDDVGFRIGRYLSGGNGTDAN